MNREIKFRAWNKKDKYMELVDDLQMFNNDLNIGIPSEEYFLGEDEVELMQFTGLYDKNGKEIYEGDILRIKEKEKIAKHKVIPMKPIIASIEWSKEYVTYVLITTSIKDAFESIADYLEEYDIEVIGNVYENSELLEGE